jgi:hypothetical protein
VACEGAVDLVLRPIGGCDKSVKTCQLQQETDEANAASADLDTDEMESQNQSRQKGQSRTTLKELSDFRTDIESVMPGVPRLQGASGHLKPLGGLTLGDALRLQVEVLLKQLSPLETIPELMTVKMVAGWKIASNAHGYLSLKPSSNHAL